MADGVSGLRFIGSQIRRPQCDLRDDVYDGCRMMARQAGATEAKMFQLDLEQTMTAASRNSGNVEGSRAVDAVSDRPSDPMRRRGLKGSWRAYLASSSSESGRNRDVSALTFSA